MKSMGIAAGVGIVVGVLLSRKSDSSRSRRD
ncbi:MAG: glycine zipper domain-containing protein [Steroidobacteraceae bacterium]